MTDDITMARVREIADAVLYEGYLLYPYRRSAIKNRQRWTFGVVYPHEYSEARGGVEPWTMRTECIIEGDAATTLDVTVRFLHLIVSASTSSPTTGRPDAWEEAAEREESVSGLALSELAEHPQRTAIEVPGERIVERGCGPAAEVVREQLPLAGAVTVAAESVEVGHARLFRVSVLIENASPADVEAESGRHDGVPAQAFVSTHTILRVRGGAFVSLTDPPDTLAEAARACRNERTWPVLAGEEGSRDIMLSSPIILYDYPQIAPESPGALFDGTEIDEILTLRILTLTDDEKDEMRQGDERARAILERSEALTADDLMKLHGTIRSLRPIVEGGGA